MPVLAMSDGHVWGNLERLPDFVIIKVPGISTATLDKYFDVWLNPDDTPLQRRRWRVRLADMPAAARQKLATDGELTIKAGSYSGPFDYTWTQVKSFFRNDETGLDETVDI